MEILVATELFEFEDGNWTGRVTGPGQVQIGEDTFPITIEGAIQHQTVQGVWVRSASAERRPSLGELPPGKNLVEWLLGVLEKFDKGPAECTEVGWCFHLREELEEVRVEVVQVAPGRWRIELHDLQGCSILVFFSTPDRRFLRSAYHAVLGALESVDGIKILERPQ